MGSDEMAGGGEFWEQLISVCLDSFIIHFNISLNSCIVDFPSVSWAMCSESSMRLNLHPNIEPGDPPETPARRLITVIEFPEKLQLVY